MNRLISYQRTGRLDWMHLEEIPVAPSSLQKAGLAALALVRRLRVAIPVALQHIQQDCTAHLVS